MICSIYKHKRSYELLPSCMVTFAVNENGKHKVRFITLSFWCYAIEFTL